jgi:Tol biopolymer transport system component
MQRSVLRCQALAAAGIAAAALSVSACQSDAKRPAMYSAFANPRAVSIRGYSGDAMEPFMTPDGRYLLFNSLNQPPAHTTLRYATRIDDFTFTYQGELAGANDRQALTAVPAVAGDQTLYFISTRSYQRTLSTVYAAHFDHGIAAGVTLVPGLATRQRGIIDFDVDVSVGGTWLFVSQGRFSGGPAPDSARLLLYVRERSGFVLDPRSDRILAAVNDTSALVYAAAVSASGRELFFTAAQPGAPPSIYRAVRDGAGQPFRDVQRVAAAAGFAEAPALSPDGGRVLYYHRRVGHRFLIYAATRR